MFSVLQIIRNSIMSFEVLYKSSPMIKDNIVNDFTTVWRERWEMFVKVSNFDLNKRERVHLGMMFISLSSTIYLEQYNNTF